MSLNPHIIRCSDEEDISDTPVVMDENDELNSLLSFGGDESQKQTLGRGYDVDDDEEDADPKFAVSAVQWSTSNGNVFVPTGPTVDRLIPGVYDIQMHPSIGLYFERIPVRTDGLLDFPDANTHRVITEIQKFWEREEVFREFKLTYKRGILLWGPPGGGKSCTLQLVSRDVIARGGIVIKFDNPGVFTSGLRKLREIQPETPVVVLMEDIDSIIRYYSESEVINLLDGVDRLDKIVFLATTNYPEMLGDRIMNRPSRFDKRFKVGYPSAEARKMYLEFLRDGRDIPEMDVDQWVEDSADFSIAHLKEMFVAVVVLGDPYDDALKTLKSMRTHIESGNDSGEGGIGLRSRSSGNSMAKAIPRVHPLGSTW